MHAHKERAITQLKLGWKTRMLHTHTRTYTHILVRTI
uniref:Uncharacterized protein n=1 Tax=Anguilla anguilla TaxID=7936 RepID=A0A0E9UUX5_ANGAN